MTMYARVEQGVVRELLETDQQIEELYHPDLLWVDVHDIADVRPGWIVGHEGFAPPEPEKTAITVPTVDIAELVSQVRDLHEQIRVLALDATARHSGET